MRKLKRARAYLFLFVCIIFCSVQTVEILCAVKISGGGSTSVAYDAFLSNDEILSVYRDVGSTSPEWTKYGYNASLRASATKIETNNPTALTSALLNADANGNADLTKINKNLSRGVDDYTGRTIPVYGKIDYVNIDILTGELIGRYSDPNYKFEWFGRSVSLPSGSTLASGRTLTQDETFSVDCYTYYPTMYMRRCIENGKVWLSVSEKKFQNSVEIPEFYIATFTATLYNPDHTLANNEFGVIPRSYNSGRAIYSLNRGEVLNKFYASEGYPTFYNTFTQAEELKFCTNLTKAWKNKPSNLNGYKCASLCQGENYVAYVFSYLYLIKYANFDSQQVVGYGNVNSYSKYRSSYANKTEYINDRGETFSVDFSNDSNYFYLESIKSGGTIGLFDGEGAVSAGMQYGYTIDFTNNGDQKGIYSTQFLSYNNGEYRVLVDGYVGTDSYTSVLCLGQFDPWGNASTWIFGQAIISDGENLYLYSQNDNYDYEFSSGNSYQNGNYITTSFSGYDENVSKLFSANYQKVSYNIAINDASSTNSIYSGLGVDSTPSSLMNLIGMPSTNTQKVTSHIYGTCDGLEQKPTKIVDSEIFGIMKGGSTYYGGTAGLFFRRIYSNVNYTTHNIALRMMLV